MTDKLITPLLRQVLAARGIVSDDDIAYFLHYPTIDELEVLTGLPNAKRAATELIEAIKAGKHITILGDYDCDGVSAITIMQRGIKALANSLKVSVDVDYLIPNRFDDGYGLTATIIEKIRQIAPELVVTVDNGSSAAPEIAQLLELGMQVIVTDHHELGEPITHIAHVNPKLSNMAVDDNPLYNICGATVALGVIIAASNLLETKYNAGKIQWPALINYAALATIADVMPLVGINRSIVKLGLEQINTGQNQAVRALFELANEKRNYSENSIIYTALDLSFNVIPAINSAGRIGSSDIAADLLLEPDADKRAKLAAELFDINEQRKALGDQVLAEAEAQCWAQLDQGLDTDVIASPNSFHSRQSIFLSQIQLKQSDEVPALFCKGEDWHEGVLGIVAGRLMHEFKRTVFVFTKGKFGETEVLKGSARGAEGVDLHAAISSQLDLLIRFGGHKAAAGLTLEQVNYQEFTEKVSIALKSQIDSLVSEASSLGGAELEIVLGEMNIDNVQSLALLEPTGAGNPRVILSTPGVMVSDWRVVGASQNHLSLSVYDDTITERDSIKSIWFGNNKLPVSESGVYEISYIPTINEFRGTQSVNLQIQIMEPNSG